MDLFGMRPIGKKGASNGVMVAIILIAILAFATGKTGTPGEASSQPLPGTNQASTSTPATFCPDSSSTVTIGPAKKRWAPGTSVSTENHRLFKGGVDQGLKQDGTTVSYKQGDKYNLVYFENSTTYYAAQTPEITVPCGPSNSADAFASSTDTKNKYLYQGFQEDATPTISAFNDEDDVLNQGGIAGNQTIGSGGAGGWKVRFQTDDATGYAPYGGIVVTLDLNNTLYDPALVKVTSLSGVSYPQVSKPSAVKSILAVDANMLSFKVPGGPDPGNYDAKYLDTYFNIKLNAKSGQDPIDVAGDINTTFCPENYIQHTITGQELLAAEDNAGTLAAPNNRCSSIVLHVD